MCSMYEHSRRFVPALEGRDWLLLFAACAGAEDGLDPVRIQEGMFLFAQRAQAPAGSKYAFEAHLYGPMSHGVYDDLDCLVAEGLLERRPVTGKRWSRYRASRKGLGEGERILRGLRREGLTDAAGELLAIKEEVANATFGELLASIHGRYPEFAVNSVFRT
jgi:hypothetical protein